MSANKDQMQANFHGDEINESSRKFLFVRVCYRHKCKLRSFECFPSFQELIDEIQRIYPSTRSQLECQRTEKDSNHHDAEHKTNKISYEWRLETDDAEWIENENDWKALVEFMKHSNALSVPTSSEKNSSSAKEKNHGHGKQMKHTQKSQQKQTEPPIQLNLHLVIKDPEDDPYNPEMPTFVKCYKNPLTLIHQRPPPPPYQPDAVVNTSHSQLPSFPNPFAPSLPYYPSMIHHHQPLYGAAALPPPNHPASSLPPMSNGGAHPHASNGDAPNLNTRAATNGTITDGAAGPPPAKKRKFSENPPPCTASPITPSSSSVIPAPPPISTASAPAAARPSGPPPAELLDANPYGMVHMNGYVWCDACNGWFELHCFDSHLQGKKHTKNIEAFSFRKVLKHWQRIRTKVVEDVTTCKVNELSVNDNLWYAQVCLACLSEVHYSSWRQHVSGQVHQNNFMKCPRTVVLNRKMAPGNEGYAGIPTLFAEKYFTQISNYVAGSKVLVLGEQDFSYSLAVCNILQSGQTLVGTSYLGPYDPSSEEPEEHPADDGVRANYFRKTLPSHSGSLQQNLQFLHALGAQTAHSIDATKLYECLSSTQPAVYTGPFDIVVFPFPRASLKRGLDFRNSTLIQGFFQEIRQNREKLLYPLAQIQMIVLDNQFKEWDITNIAKENGWTLKWRCCVNFPALPQYQPRELSGKAWNPKLARLLVFLWDSEFDKSSEPHLQQLNAVNDLALLPDEAMKVTQKAKVFNAYHLHGIRQYQEPTAPQVTPNSLARLDAPPSSLLR